MAIDLVQISVFVLLTVGIAVATWWTCRTPSSSSGAGSAAPGDENEAGDENKNVFLAGGQLSWIFIAGSITLTNLSTDQLVGMNGKQMLLIVWWELAAVGGLLALAYIFLPLYYKYQCTTTTELLEKRMGGGSVRMVIAGLFLLGGLFIYMPILLYTGALFLTSSFGLDLPIISVAAALATLGAAYAIFGGLKAVAVSDTYSGVGLLALGVLVVILSLSAIDFDLSGIPAERLALFGPAGSEIPWQTLLTGMIFIQIFYWSFNQVITQRAMAAKNIHEARKGVLTAGVIRLIIVPPIVVLPGIAAFKLFGDAGDSAYGMIVAQVLPGWLSGAFAAMMAAAVLTSFNSGLNAAAAIYVVDVHERVFKSTAGVRQIATAIMIGFVALSLFMVPVYANNGGSIIDTVQRLNGLLSMPILSAFVLALFFEDIAPAAATVAVGVGPLIYAGAVTLGGTLHYIHWMPVVLALCVGIGWALSRFTFGRRPRLSLAAFGQ